LLAGARGFYLSLFERVFHVKILCLRAVISFSFFVIAYRVYNKWYQSRRFEIDRLPGRLSAALPGSIAQRLHRSDQESLSCDRCTFRQDQSYQRFLHRSTASSIAASCSFIKIEVVVGKI
jgi:hypothetical protein